MDIEKKAKRRKLLGKIIFWLALASFVWSIIYVIWVLAKWPDGDATVTYRGRYRSDYVLMIAQCMLGIIVMFLPNMVARKFNIVVPSGLMIMYIVFLYCSIYLGEVESYYYKVKHWDVILHFFSAVMLGCLGFSFVSILNKEEKVFMNMSPMFVTLFAFCFAVTLGAIWEIYEFSFDGILGLNMQKFILSDGTVLVGRAALKDTMKDIIVDSAGAFLACTIGYISIKRKDKRFNNLLLKKKKDIENSEISE